MPVHKESDMGEKQHCIKSQTNIPVWFTENEAEWTDQGKMRMTSLPVTRRTTLVT